MAIAISAVVPTFNRSTYLRKTIAALLQQTLDKANYEIIVVDNCSTDGTKAVVCEEFKHASNLRYVHEPRLGLNPARNRGLVEARADIVAYLDDDAIPSVQWLESIVECFRTIRPTPGCVGGKVEPIWEEARPEWLEDELLPYLTVIDHSPMPKFLSEKRWPKLVGANIAFSKAALQAIGGFVTGIDRTGNNLLSGGEILAQWEIERRGLGIYYDPRVLVQHLVPASRATQHYLVRRAYWGGVGDAMCEYYAHEPSLSRALKTVYWATRSLVRSPGIVLDTVMPRRDRFVSRVEALTRWGFFVGALKTIPHAVLKKQVLRQ